MQSNDSRFLLNGDSSNRERGPQSLALAPPQREIGQEKESLTHLNVVLAGMSRPVTEMLQTIMTADGAFVTVVDAFSLETYLRHRWIEEQPVHLVVLGAASTPSRTITSRELLARTIKTGELARRVTVVADDWLVGEVAGRNSSGEIDEVIGIPSDPRTPLVGLLDRTREALQPAQQPMAPRK